MLNPTEELMKSPFANLKEDRLKENKELKQERTKENNELKQEIQEMIKQGITSEIDAATKPMKESQDKLVQDHAELARNVQELTRKVNEIEKVKVVMGERQNEGVSGVSVPIQQLHKSQGIRNHVNVTQSRDQEAIMKLFKMSNLALGLSPISEEIFDVDMNKQIEETGLDRKMIEQKVMKEAVKEFLMMEMKVKEDHIEKLGIVRIFAPQKSNWNTLYIQLETQEQVDWVMSHTRWIPEVEEGQVSAKVIKYIPRQLYSRWNAIQGLAFQIRKNSNWGVQTKIGHGIDDFFLQTRPKGDTTWSSDVKLSGDLPKVDLAFMSRETRSPTSAPGRDQYKQRTEKQKNRPSSDSSSSSSPPSKQANNHLDKSIELTHESGLLAKPDISRTVEFVHPPGSPGQGLRNPSLFNHLNSAHVSSRKKQ